MATGYGFFIRVKHAFLKLRVSKMDYFCVLEDIRNSNRRTLKATSVILTLLFFGLWMLVARSSSHFLEANAFIYAYLTISSAVIAVLSITLFKKTPRLVMWFAYFLLANCLIYGIVVGIINQPEHYAASYNAILPIMPILFIDRNWRMMSFTAFFEMIFCYLAWKYKVPEMAAMDTINSVCFTLVSFGFCIYMNHMHIADFLLRKTIKIERDYDGMTAVLTKVAFRRDVLKDLGKENPCGILMIVDIDNFKSINDGCGHDVGDQVIKDIARTIKSNFRTSDVVGRFGGDEFVVYMPSTKDFNLGELKAASMVRDIQEKVKIGEEQKSASVSIGFTMVCATDNYDSLLKRADQALYKAKKNGKNRYEYELLKTGENNG
ncbi:MAG: GGDEF domain-containing protein [Treponema sp.]|nr:GGDEF domain-containing protein [Candidatus Treponema equifaecale]